MRTPSLDLTAQLSKFSDCFIQVQHKFIKSIFPSYSPGV